MATLGHYQFTLKVSERRGTNSHSEISNFMSGLEGFERAWNWVGSNGTSKGLLPGLADPLTAIECYRNLD